MARYNNERDIKIFSKLPQGADSTHKSIQDIMLTKNEIRYLKINILSLTIIKFQKLLLLI